MKRSISVLLVLLWLCPVLVAGSARAGRHPPAHLEGLAHELRQIRYSFTIQNMKNTVLPKAELWLSAPVKETSVQQCIKLGTSQPYDLLHDDLGNQVIHLSLFDIPPYATRIVTVKAQLKLSSKPKSIPVSDIEIFLRPERYIESGHPEIIKLARALKAGNDRETARNIFRWVSDSIRYIGYLRNPRGALYALRNRKGDCTEFMCLFVALCRADNIPARGIGGYVCTGNCTLTASNYHNWAEFYLDGSWRIADPQKKVFMKDENQYIAMKVIMASAENPMGEFHRYRFVGDGLKVTMN